MGTRSSTYVHTYEHIPYSTDVPVPFSDPVWVLCQDFCRVVYTGAYVNADVIFFHHLATTSLASVWWILHTHVRTCVSYVYIEDSRFRASLARYHFLREENVFADLNYILRSFYREECKRFEKFLGHSIFFLPCVFSLLIRSPFRKGNRKRPGGKGEERI